MTIKFISDHDYAQVGYHYAKALKEFNVSSDSYCLSAHPYSYKERSLLVKLESLRDKLKGCDLVVIMHSCAQFINHIPNGIPYIVMHGGSKYRKQSDNYNELFRDARGTIIQTPDLLGLGANNEVLIGCPVDMSIQQVGFQSVKTKFGHYPSNPMTKGTEQIKQALVAAGVVDNIGLNTSLLPHRKNLERIASCGIYIELFKPLQNVHVYGTFGVTALEAAMIGRPVITQCANYDKYLERYGVDCFRIVQDFDDLVQAIKGCSTMNISAIEHWGNTCRQLVMQEHHPNRIGQQLLTFIKSVI